MGQMNIGAYSCDSHKIKDISKNSRDDIVVEPRIWSSAADSIQVMAMTLSKFLFE